MGSIAPAKVKLSDDALTRAVARIDDVRSRMDGRLAAARGDDDAATAYAALCDELQAAYGGLVEAATEKVNHWVPTADVIRGNSGD